MNRPYVISSNNFLIQNKGDFTLPAKRRRLLERRRNLHFKFALMFDYVVEFQPPFNYWIYVYIVLQGSSMPSSGTLPHCAMCCEEFYDQSCITVTVQLSVIPCRALGKLNLNVTIGTMPIHVMLSGI
jgi:hypothetical protein